MQPLATHDLVMSAFAVVAMPLVILANLRGAASHSVLHTYLWREHPSLMRLMLVILAMVTMFAAISLLAHKGVLSPAQEETLSMCVAIPFLFVSLAAIVLAVIATVRFFGAWWGDRLRG